MPASKKNALCVMPDKRVAYGPRTGHIKTFGNGKVLVYSRHSSNPSQDQIFNDFYKQLGSYIQTVKFLTKNARTFKDVVEVAVFMAFVQNHAQSSALTPAFYANYSRAAYCDALKILPIKYCNLTSHYGLQNMVSFVSNVLEHTEFPNLDQGQREILTAWDTAYGLLTCGTWVTLSWAELDRLPLTQELLTNFIMQLPHVSVEKPEMIAYYQTEDKIVRRIETRTAAGRYFRKLYPAASDDLVRELATAHTQRVSGSDLNFVESSDDPDDWYQVYRNGPDSCIGQRPWAAEAYAYPGNTLRLAYLGTMDNPTARSIVVDAGPDPETGEPRKGYIRMYGDRDRLKFALAIAGYSRQVDLYEFGPVKLRKIERDGGIVCPYVDGNDPYVTDEGDHLVIDSCGDFCAQNSNNIGYLEDGGSTCDMCGSRESEDDIRYIEGHGSICDDCTDNHFQTPEVGNKYGDWFHNDDCVEVIDNRGNQVGAVLAYVNRSGDYVRLENEYDGIEYCHMDCAVYVDGEGYFHESDDDIIYLEYMSGYALFAETVEAYDDQRYHKDDVVLMHDGFYAFEQDPDLVYTRHGWALDGDCVELDDYYHIEGCKDTVTHALASDDEELLRNQAEEVQESAPV